MFGTFSTRARQVVFATRFKAGQRGAGRMEVGDLLLGLIVEDQGLLRDLLSTMHEGQEVTSEFPRPSHSPFFPLETARKLLAEIEAVLPQAAAIPLSKEVPLSPELERAFDRAKDLQKMFHHEEIGPLHLLAAVLAEEASREIKLMQNSGITKEHVLNKLKAMKIDDEKKQVSRDLTKAINEAIAESKSIAEVVSKARAAGLDIALHLDGTVSLKRLGFQQNPIHGRQILESLQIRVDFDESAES